MIRKQIVIEPEQDKLLADLAGRLGVSQSQIIRAAIDFYAGSRGDEAARLKAEEELFEMFRKAPSRGLTDEHGNRTWTREGLHERGSR